MQKSSKNTETKEKKSIFKNKSKLFKVLFILSIPLVISGGVLVWFFFFNSNRYVLDKAKVYDYKDRVISQDVHITTDGAKLKNATIEGDLYIDVTVGDGHVEIENVVAKGKTYIYGGGKDTVMVIGGRIYEALGEFNGRIHAINWASLDRIIVKSSDLILKTDETAEIKKVELLVPETSIETETNIELDGNFGEVKDNGEADLTLKEGTRIEVYIPACMGSGCNHSKKKSTVTMEKDTNIKKATVNKPTKWEGEGTIDEMDIQSEDVTVDVEIEKVTNEEGYDVDGMQPSFVTAPVRTKMDNKTGDYEVSFEVNSKGTIYFIFQPPENTSYPTPSVAQLKKGEGNSICSGGNCPPSVVSSKSVEVTDPSKAVLVSGYYGDSESGGMRPDFGDDFDPSCTLFAVFENSSGEASEVMRVEF